MVWVSFWSRRVPERPKPGEPKRARSLAVEVRGDWRRSRTQTASRREVLPWALSPVKRVRGPSRGQERAWKQRKSRRRREESMAEGERMAQERGGVDR